MKTTSFKATAMILAAGRGERMKPLTDTCPKPLLEVNGKPLIVYHIEKLVSLGVKQIVINIAWLGDKIKSALGGGLQWNIEIIYSDEGDSALETAGGIVKALPYLANKFWVINADVYSDINFINTDITDELAMLVLVENPSFHPKGDFGIENGLLQSSAQKQFTFSGIGFYSKEFFANLTQGKRPLAPLIRQHADNHQIKAMLHQGFWSDVGTPDRLSNLQGKT